MDRRKFVTSSLGLVDNVRFGDGTPAAIPRVWQNSLLRWLILIRIITLAELMMLSAHAVAQSSNASLTGRITDSSKAVTPDAKVVAINTGTRVRYETVTNETGS